MRGIPRAVACAVVVFIGSLFVSVNRADANLILNGSFESETVDGLFLTVGNGESALTHWTVGGSSIDIVHSSYISAYDGSQLVDLEGSPGPGSISQSFATTVGQQYELSFVVGSLGKSATVSLTGTHLNLSSVITHSDITSAWTQYGITFTALDPLTTLMFESFEGSNDGLLLDAVSVTAMSQSVPEPSSLVLLGAGLLGLIGYRSRKRTTSAAVNA